MTLILTLTIAGVISVTVTLALLTLRARHEERQGCVRCNWHEYVRRVRLRGEVVE